MIGIYKIHDLAKLPVRSTELAGAWDLTVTEIIRKGNLVRCKLGYAMDIPKGFRFRIVPRSNLTKYDWIMNNSPAVIDADYTDEIEVRFRVIPYIITPDHLVYEDFPYKVGDRVAQGYLEKIIDIEYEFIPKNYWEGIKSEKENYRSGGFGSTGM